MSTIVRIVQTHTWPKQYTTAVQVEHSSSDLNAEDMHQMLYQAMIAMSYCKETVDEIRTGDDPEAE